MAAIAATQVSLYPDKNAVRFVGGMAPRQLVERRLKITSVTAADTVTAAVLGLKKIISVSNAYNGTSAGVVPVAVNPVNNQLLIGAGPTAATIYLAVTGEP